MQKSRSTSSTKRAGHNILICIKISPTQGKERHNLLNTLFGSRVSHAIPDARASSKNFKPLGMPTFWAGSMPKGHFRIKSQTLWSNRFMLCKIVKQITQCLTLYALIGGSHRRNHLHKLRIFNHINKFKDLR